MTTAAKATNSNTADQLYPENIDNNKADTQKPAEDQKPADEKPADEKPADEKPADEKPVDDKKPDEKLETDKAKEEKPAEKPKELTKESLKIPKDSQLSAAAVDEIVAFAKAHGLSQEQAQAHMEREVQVRTAVRADIQKEVDAKVNGWTEESENDKEFGGDKFKETQVRCNSLLKKHGSETFVKALIESGLSNHPEVIRFMNRVAKTMDPDQLILAGAQVTDSGEKDAASILYDGGGNQKTE